MSVFKERLKELRQEKGITQEELADVLDIDRSQISKYENPKRKKIVPTVDTAEAMAEHFNVSIDYLIGRSDIKNPYSNKRKNIDERFLRDEFKGLCERDVEILALVAQALKYQRNDLLNTK